MDRCSHFSDVEMEAQRCCGWDVVEGSKAAPILHRSTWSLWEKRIWDPAEDGGSQEETCPVGDGDPVNDLDTPTRWRSQQWKAVAHLCLMLGFLCPWNQGIDLVWFFPKADLKQRLKGK